MKAGRGRKRKKRRKWRDERKGNGGEGGGRREGREDVVCVFRGWPKGRGEGHQSVMVTKWPGRLGWRVEIFYIGLDTL